MSQDGRASVASLPDGSRAGVCGTEGNGECAAGTVPTFAEQDREALRRLCSVGRMIRRSEGGYGTARETLITNAVAIRLKKRGLATPGFDKDMFPSLRGKQIMAEESRG